MRLERGAVNATGSADIKKFLLTGDAGRDGISLTEAPTLRPMSD